MAVSVRLEDLAASAPDMDEVYLRFLGQNCAACLLDQNHSSGVEFEIEYSGADWRFLLLHSVVVDQKFLNTYVDLQDRVESGAAAIAILLSPPLLGFRVVQRSRKHNGYDYRLGNGDELLPLNGGPKLEVSGIQRARGSWEITARENEKRNRLAVYDERPPVDTPTQPTFVFVLDFGEPRGRMTEHVHRT